MLVRKAQGLSPFYLIAAHKGKRLFHYFFAQDEERAPFPHASPQLLKSLLLHTLDPTRLQA
ncbi:MAG TPA: hypothetical protein DCS30_07875 [Rhizobiales bacterium]|nr:hypothetical protein [Hyphomicrobiales bacterium]